MSDAIIFSNHNGAFVKIQKAFSRTTASNNGKHRFVCIHFRNWSHWYWFQIQTWYKIRQFHLSPFLGIGGGVWSYSTTFLHCPVMTWEIVGTFAIVMCDTKLVQKGKITKRLSLNISSQALPWDSCCSHRLSLVLFDWITWFILKWIQSLLYSIRIKIDHDLCDLYFCLITLFHYIF